MHVLPGLRFDRRVTLTKDTVETKIPSRVEALEKLVPLQKQLENQRHQARRVSPQQEQAEKCFWRRLTAINVEI